jgi:predicted Zn-dependent peptidase
MEHHHMSPCDEHDRAKIVRAAWERRQYVLWLADKLEHPVAGTDENIRRESAKELRQLVSLE